jgi:hypothetical protein
MSPIKPDFKHHLPRQEDPERQLVSEKLIDVLTKDLEPLLAQELIQKIDAESTGMGGGGSTGDSDAGSGDQSQMASSLKNPIEMAV